MQESQKQFVAEWKLEKYLKSIILPHQNRTTPWCLKKRFFTINILEQCTICDSLSASVGICRKSQKSVITSRPQSQTKKGRKWSWFNGVGCCRSRFPLNLEGRFTQRDSNRSFSTAHNSACVLGHAIQSAKRCQGNHDAWRLGLFNVVAWALPSKLKSDRVKSPRVRRP